MTLTPVVATGLAEPRRFTIDEYHRMGDAGILGEDDRVELIRGELIQMWPVGHLHRVTVDVLNHQFVVGLNSTAVVRTQGSIQLPILGSEPQPDLCVLRWRPDFYADKVATAEDIALIIEVADSSLRYDSEVKATLYAEAEIPEYWLWDLVHRLLLVHREPTPEGYRVLLTLRGDDPVSPLAFPELALTLNQVLLPTTQG